MPKGYRRGYAVAVLIGLESDHAALWQIFSQVAKHQQQIALNGSRNDSRAVYSFHESIVNALRPALREGVKSIVVASPAKTSWAQDFLSHLKSHHNWLFQGANKAVFSTIASGASSHSEVSALTKTEAFKTIISEATSQETENLVEILEKRLNSTDNLVAFSLEEAESLIYCPQLVGKPSPEYLLLTDDYLAKSRRKNSVHRLMQIAKNKGVKTRVIAGNSAAGKRLAQFGGLVCLLRLG